MERGKRSRPKRAAGKGECCEKEDGGWQAGTFKRKAEGIKGGVQSHTRKHWQVKVVRIE